MKWNKVETGEINNKYQVRRNNPKTTSSNLELDVVILVDCILVCGVLIGDFRLTL